MSSKNPITGQPCTCAGHRGAQQGNDLIGPSEPVGWNSERQVWELCPSNPPRNNTLKVFRYGWTIEAGA